MKETIASLEIEKVKRGIELNRKTALLTEKKSEGIRLESDKKQRQKVLVDIKQDKYKLEKNAVEALKAGCNLVLHCNGKISEMSRLAKVIPKIDNFTQKKTSHFYKFLG